MFRRNRANSTSAPLKAEGRGNLCQPVNQLKQEFLLKIDCIDCFFYSVVRDGHVPGYGCIDHDVLGELLDHVPILKSGRFCRPVEPPGWSSKTPPPRLENRNGSKFTRIYRQIESEPLRNLNESIASDLIIVSPNNSATLSDFNQAPFHCLRRVSEASARVTVTVSITPCLTSSLRTSLTC
jgi:hypothetical protein